MPVFFFHVEVGRHLDEDTIGVDLADLDAVRGEALWAIADTMRDAAVNGTAVTGEAFEIVDEDGRAVLTIPFYALLDRPRHG